MCTYEELETGVVGFTFDDAYDVILASTKESVVAAPKNESRLSTVCGPINAARKHSGNLKKFLFK